MTQDLETCWTLIRGAAAGESDSRTRFTELYLPMVRTCLAARWRGRELRAELDDAVQEVFVECLRERGAVERAVSDVEVGFRAFLLGTTRNVARRVEERCARRAAGSAQVEACEEELEALDATLSQAFDRAWVAAILDEAKRVHRRHAEARGEEAVRRFELLRLRFSEGLPIREIARRWEADPARLHHECSRARGEFREALRETLAVHSPKSPAAAERDFVELLDGWA